MDGETFVLGLLALLTIVTSVLLWNVFATARAKIAASRDGDFQRLAERTVDAQQRSAESLADLTRRLDTKLDDNPATPPDRP
jgi:cytochrome c-type biogenesis protein CcmH/NrfG